MIVLTKTGGVAMTNCFLVADEQAKQAVLFDAPDHTVAPLLDEAVRRGWDVKGLWLTHGHFDHFADHTVVRQRFPNAKILAHAQETDKTSHPDIQLRLFSLPLIIQPLVIDEFVTEGQELKIGSIEVRVMHTPGHSPGHVVYHFPKEKLLIGGDMIIGGAVGRTDFPDSDHQDMIASLLRIMQLPSDTRLLGGHGEATTLQEERETNYFLQSVIDGGE
jgi:glyoxylase-like metal-dependent hydrolase (beta-lactamase superfamily II)